MAPDCCTVCGPSVSFLNADGTSVDGNAFEREQKALRTLIEAPDLVVSGFKAGNLVYSVYHPMQMLAQGKPSLEKRIRPLVRPREILLHRPPSDRYSAQLTICGVDLATDRAAVCACGIQSEEEKKRPCLWTLLWRPYTDCGRSGSCTGHSRRTARPARRRRRRTNQTRCRGTARYRRSSDFAERNPDSGQADRRAVAAQLLSSACPTTANAVY